MPTIFLLGFRGTGGVTNPKHKHFGEHALVRAGHVAIGGVIPDKFIGFSPTPEAAEAAGGELALLQLLKDHLAQPGCLQDDTEIFHRAKILAAEDKRTTVYKLNIEVSDETIETIKKWYNEKKEAMYNFPNDEDGKFNLNEYNCAVFPALLGVEIPTDVGRILQYVEEMKAKGATEW